MIDDEERELRARARLVEALSSSVSHGGENLQTAVGALTRVIEEGSWKEFITRDGKHVKPASFEEFVTTQPLSGLGVDIGLVRRVVGDDVALRDKLDQALKRPNGGDRRTRTNNIHSAPDPAGTSKDAALRRLRSQAPELHAQVLAGELSPHAAAIKAGFRHPTATIRTDDPAAAVRTLLRHFTAQQIKDAL